MLKDNIEMNQCQHCDKAFKRPQDLKTHTTKQHKNMPVETIKPAEFIKSIIDDLITNMTIETQVETQDSEISFNLSEDSNNECDPETLEDDIYENEPVYQVRPRR